MKSVAIVSGLLMLSGAACGNATDSGSSGSTNGGVGSGAASPSGGGGAGASAGLGLGGLAAAAGTVGSGGSALVTSGGATGRAGSAGSGGSLGNAGGVSGSTGNAGGASGSAGSVSGAGAAGTLVMGASTPGYPSGNVTSCFGGCPMGPCDNQLFFASVPCTSVYQAPVDASSAYCNAAQSASYCIVASGSTGRFRVSCDNGVATSVNCTGGCVGGNTEMIGYCH